MKTLKQLLNKIKTRHQVRKSNREGRHKSMLLPPKSKTPGKARGMSDSPPSLMCIDLGIQCCHPSLQKLTQSLQPTKLFEKSGMLQTDSEEPWHQFPLTSNFRGWVHLAFGLGLQGLPSTTLCLCYMKSMLRIPTLGLLFKRSPKSRIGHCRVTGCVKRNFASPVHRPWKRRGNMPRLHHRRQTLTYKADLNSRMICPLVPFDVNPVQTCLKLWGNPNLIDPFSPTPCRLDRLATLPCSKVLNFTEAMVNKPLNLWQLTDSIVEISTDDPRAHCLPYDAINKFSQACISLVSCLCVSGIARKTIQHTNLNPHWTNHEPCYLDTASSKQVRIKTVGQRTCRETWSQQNPWVNTYLPTAPHRTWLPRHQIFPRRLQCLQAFSKLDKPMLGQVRLWVHPNMAILMCNLINLRVETWRVCNTKSPCGITCVWARVCRFTYATKSSPH